MFLGRNYVLTFQERPGDCLEPVRERLRRRRGRIRSAGADYLAYALLDAVVDFYFPVIDDCGDQLEDLDRRPVLAGLVHRQALDGQPAGPERILAPALWMSSPQAGLQGGDAMVLHRTQAQK